MLLTLAEFFDSLRGIILVGLAISLGGMTWERCVLGWSIISVPVRQVSLSSPFGRR
jgi:hypothetical protein